MNDMIFMTILHFEKDEEILTMITDSFLDLNPTFSEFDSDSEDTSQDMKDLTLNHDEVGL